MEEQHWQNKSASDYHYHIAVDDDDRMRMPMIKAFGLGIESGRGLW